MTICRIPSYCRNFQEMGVIKFVELEEITVAFLDVGQGDSTVLIPSNSSTAVVVDCPSKGVTLEYLKQKKISNIHVFVTHTDLDHMGGAAILVENTEQVETLAYNHDTFLIAEDRRRRRTILKHLVRLRDKRDIRTYSPHAGQSWEFQGIVIDAMHPADEDIKRTVSRGDTNNASVVLRASFAQRRVLLTADVEGDGWQWIIKRNTDLRADVLKFPHHGAWFDTTDQQFTLEKILQQINPTLVILSVGTGNSYDHPKLNTFKLLQFPRSKTQLRFLCTEATEKCYSVLKTTSQKAHPCAGTIEIVIGKDGIKVTPDPIRHLEVISPFDNPQCERDVQSV